MSLWKQFIIAIILAAGASAGWFVLSPQGAAQLQAALGESDAGEAEGRPQMRGGEARGERAGGGRFAGRRGGMAGPVPVVTAEVGEVMAGDTVRAIGTARAARSVTLYPLSQGIVTEIGFRPGEPVEAGAVIVRLDDAEQALAVEQAQIGLRTASETLARYERLAGSQAIPTVQLEEARSAEAAARTELRIAELALERRNIVAPFAGTMGLAQISVGDMVTTTSPIANLDDRANLFVEFTLPERYAGLVVTGQNVEATTAAYGSEAFTGAIEALDSRVDPTTRSLTARASLANDDDRLRPGMSFMVALGFEGTSHPSVPEVALQWDRDGAFVWRVTDGRAEKVSVEIVARRQGAVLVAGEIGPDEVVVSEGVQRLREGSEVAVETAATAPAARL